VERIARRNNDGNRAGCFLGRTKPSIAPNQHHVHLEPSKLTREFRVSIQFSFHPSGFDDDVLSLHIPQFTQALSETVIHRGCCSEISKPAESRHFVRLLSARRDRQANKTEREGESQKPHVFVHSITSPSRCWRQKMLIGGRILRAEERDAGRCDQTVRLLCARSDWPRCCRAAECGQQFPPSDVACMRPV